MLFSWSIGTPLVRPLFSVPAISSSTIGGSQFMITRNGQRFLILAPVEKTADQPLEVPSTGDIGSGIRRGPGGFDSRCISTLWLVLSVRADRTTLTYSCESPCFICHLQSIPLDMPLQVNTLVLARCFFSHPFINSIDDKSPIHSSSMERRARGRIVGLSYK